MKDNKQKQNMEQECSDTNEVKVSNNSATKRKVSNKSNSRRVKPRRGTQGSKDSNSKRVNYDNERVSKFDKERGIPKGRRGDVKNFSRVEVSRENDVSWYNKVPSLYGPATNVSFNPVTGLPAEVIAKRAIPGIYTDYWQPYIGDAEGEVLNQIKESLYSFVVHANSRNTSYNSSDLMCTFLAAGNVFSLLATYIKAYGLMRNWQATNMYTPKALLVAMGFNFEDLESNYPNMLFDINQMIVQSRQIWCPTDFTFVTRWFWMNSNVYMDSNTTKAQYYQHVQNVYWQFNENGSTNGTCLVPVSLSTKSGWNKWTGTLSSAMKNGKTGGSGITWARAKEFFKLLMGPLLTSTYRGIMMGDILKAYSTNDLFIVSEIPADYQVVPTYSQEVLMQFENSIPLNVISDDVSYGVMADAGTDDLMLSPFFMNSTSETYLSPSATNAKINFHKQDVTSDDLMVATRLRVQEYPLKSTYVVSSYGKFIPDGWNSSTAPVLSATLQNIPMPVAGTEVITGTMIISLQYEPQAIGTEGVANSGWNYFNLMWINPSYMFPGVFDRNTNVGARPWDFAAGNDPSAEELYQLMSWNNFDWAPMLYVPVDNGGVYEYQQIADFDNYTDLPDLNLRNMHTAALFSQFSVPYMG